MVVIYLKNRTDTNISETVATEVISHRGYLFCFKTKGTVLPQSY